MGLCWWKSNETGTRCRAVRGGMRLRGAHRKVRGAVDTAQPKRDQLPSTAIHRPAGSKSATGKRRLPVKRPLNRRATKATAESCCRPPRSTKSWPCVRKTVRAAANRWPSSPQKACPCCDRTAASAPVYPRVSSAAGALPLRQSVNEAPFRADQTRYPGARLMSIIAMLTGRFRLARDEATARRHPGREPVRRDRAGRLRARQQRHRGTSHGPGECVARRAIGLHGRGGLCAAQQTTLVVDGLHRGALRLRGSHASKPHAQVRAWLPAALSNRTPTTPKRDNRCRACTKCTVTGTHSDPEASPAANSKHPSQLFVRKCELGRPWRRTKWATAWPIVGLRPTAFAFIDQDSLELTNNHAERFASWSFDEKAGSAPAQMRVASSSREYSPCGPPANSRGCRLFRGSQRRWRPVVDFGNRDRCGWRRELGIGRGRGARFGVVMLNRAFLAFRVGLNDYEVASLRCAGL